MTANESKKIPFFVGNAFTSDASGGNPAAVVLLNQELPDASLQSIARNFNQPMTTFICTSPDADKADAQTASFRIRWFTTQVEVPLCGHGTLVTAGTIFSTPGIVSSSVQQLRFQGTSNLLLARKVDDEKFEITLRSGSVERVSADEEGRVGGIVKKALGDVEVRSVWNGCGKTWRGFVVVEIEEKEQDFLANQTVDGNLFSETGYSNNVITAKSSDPHIAFISRVFAPADGVPEDSVCGSAHSLMTPYWADELGYGDKQVVARQVSPRGGELGVRWDKEEETVTLQGNVRITMAGNIYL